MVGLIKLSKIEEFKKLKRGDGLIIVWNEDAEVWDKEMHGKKLYKIKAIQKGSASSKYPDEIILEFKGNIFFNFRLYVNGESNRVKEVYVLE